MTLVFQALTVSNRKFASKIIVITENLGLNKLSSVSKLNGLEIYTNETKVHRNRHVDQHKFVGGSVMADVQPTSS